MTTDSGFCWCCGEIHGEGEKNCNARYRTIWLEVYLQPTLKTKTTVNFSSNPRKRANELHEVRANPNCYEFTMSTKLGDVSGTEALALIRKAAIEELERKAEKLQEAIKSMLTNQYKED